MSRNSLWEEIEAAVSSTPLTQARADLTYIDNAKHFDIALGSLYPNEAFTVARTYGQRHKDDISGCSWESWFSLSITHFASMCNYYASLHSYRPVRDTGVSASRPQPDTGPGCDCLLPRTSDLLQILEPRFRHCPGFMPSLSSLPGYIHWSLFLRNLPIISGCPLDCSLRCGPSLGLPI